MKSINCQQIKTLKAMVEEALAKVPATRNSDITLMVEIWRRHFPQRIRKSGVDGREYVACDDLYDLPREDNIKRARAHFQNDRKLYLPTEWKIAKQRGINEDEWRVALWFPTKATSGTPKPSWIPPSEQTKLI